MKNETKLKIKKAAKVGGLIAGFLATFILGMGFGSCSEKKVQDESSQKQSQPKTLALKSVLDESMNLLRYAEVFDSRVIQFSGGQIGFIYQSGAYDTYVIDENFMPEGANYVVVYNGNLASPSLLFNGIATAIYNQIESGYNQSYDGSLFKSVPLLTGDYSSPFVLSIPSGFYYHAPQGEGSLSIRRVALCFPKEGVSGIYLLEQDYYLNSGEGVSLSFGPNWLPYGMFTQWASGNLGIAINNFGDAATTQNTLLEASFDDLLFTCGDGFAYDGLRIVARPLWDGAKYINQAGEVKTYSFSTANEYVPLVINYVDYRRFDTAAWVRVANYSLKINDDGTQIAIDPPLTWQSDLYKSPRFFRYPAGFVYPAWKISSDVGAHWSVWQPSRPPQGLTFLDWFSLRGEDIAIGNVFGNEGSNVFTLISSGFTAVLPIFNVQVLPYLTIGTLLFAPLVILLIFAILKVLNK